MILSTLKRKIQKLQNNPEIELVIAGPGGGKTHNMVEKILNCIETLSSTSYCAVITYTNAATENIKSRIEKEFLFHKIFSLEQLTVF